MNAAQSPRPPITAMMLQSLMWLWLIGLSVFVALGYQAVNEQVDQERLIDPALINLNFWILSSSVQ